MSFFNIIHFTKNSGPAHTSRKEWLLSICIAIYLILMLFAFPWVIDLIKSITSDISNNNYRSNMTMLGIILYAIIGLLLPATILIRKFLNKNS